MFVVSILLFVVNHDFISPQPPPRQTTIAGEIARVLFIADTKNIRALYRQTVEPF
jgi:hypothetical protein